MSDRHFIKDRYQTRYEFRYGKLYIVQTSASGKVDVVILANEDVCDLLENLMNEWDSEAA